MRALSPPCTAQAHAYPPSPKRRPPGGPRAAQVAQPVFTDNPRAPRGQSPPHVPPTLAPTLDALRVRFAALIAAIRQLPLAVSTCALFASALALMAVLLALLGALAWPLVVTAVGAVAMFRAARTLAADTPPVPAEQWVPLMQRTPALVSPAAAGAPDAWRAHLTTLFSGADPIPPMAHTQRLVQLLEHLLPQLDLPETQRSRLNYALQSLIHFDFSYEAICLGVRQTLRPHDAFLLLDTLLDVSLALACRTDILSELLHDTGSCSIAEEAATLVRFIARAQTQPLPALPWRDDDARRAGAQGNTAMDAWLNDWGEHFTSKYVAALTALGPSHPFELAPTWLIRCAEQDVRHTARGLSRALSAQRKSVTSVDAKRRLAALTDATFRALHMRRALPEDLALRRALPLFADRWAAGEMPQLFPQLHLDPALATFAQVHAAPDGRAKRACVDLAFAQLAAVMPVAHAANALGHVGERTVRAHDPVHFKRFVAYAVAQVSSASSASWFAQLAIARHGLLKDERLERAAANLVILESALIEIVGGL